MDDLEITKRCAVAMGLIEVKETLNFDMNGKWIWVWDEAQGKNLTYKPLRDDAQAFQLLKRFPVHCIDAFDNLVAYGPAKNEDYRELDFNRAIVECVAKLEDR